MSRLLDYLTTIYSRTRSPAKRRAIEAAASMAHRPSVARAILSEVGIEVPRPRRHVTRYVSGAKLVDYLAGIYSRTRSPAKRRAIEAAASMAHRPSVARVILSEVGIEVPRPKLRKKPTPKPTPKPEKKPEPKPRPKPKPKPKPKIREKGVILFPIRDAYKADLAEMREKVKSELAGIGYTEHEKPVVFPAKTMTTNGWMTNNLKNIRKKCIELLLFYTYYTIYWYRSRRTGKPTARIDYMVGRFRTRTLPILPENISMENLMRGMVSESPYRYDEKLSREGSEFVIGLHGPIGYYVTRWK